jgi:Glycosyltransferase family 87
MKASPWRILAAFCLVVAGIGVLTLIARNDNAGRRDFIGYWAAGQQLIHGANPYDATAVYALELSSGYDLSSPLIMRNPPEALFLALPLGLVGRNTGIVLWLIALLASLVASIRMLWALHGRPENSLHLFGYYFPPVIVCLMAGQLGILMLFGVVLFLFFHKSRPFLAGAALLLCAVKPHLFLPCGIVLIVWVVYRRAYRVLAGFAVALLAVCALVFLFDPHAWSQYSQMARASGAMNEVAPVTLSRLFRVFVDRNALWLQFLPQAAGCAWSLWYFWTRRARWDWMNQGLLVLLVSALCTPYAWFTDEAMLLPAVLAGVYCAEDSGRSLLPFGLFAGVAIVEAFAVVPITSWYYLWTVPAWIAWYLYATGKRPGIHA